MQENSKINDIYASKLAKQRHLHLKQYIKEQKQNPKAEKDPLWGNNKIEKRKRIVSNPLLTRNQKAAPSKTTPKAIIEIKDAEIE